jgi:hydroxyacylglutathione hydrolase
MAPVWRRYRQPAAQSRRQLRELPRGAAEIFGCSSISVFRKKATAGVPGNELAKLSIVKARLEKDVNGYVLISGDEAAVIDPGEPAEKLAGQLGGATLKWILATHGHPGHLAGKDGLKEATEAETGMHVADAKLFLRSADRYLLDGDELELGEMKIRVIHTPGHTPGSLSFLVANHLFTGDTLLAGGVGKEMPGSDLRLQMISIGTKLLRLPLTTAVYPGHGPATSLEAELRSNPYLRRA